MVGRGVVRFVTESTRTDSVDRSDPEPILGDHRQAAHRGGRSSGPGVRNRI